MEHKTVLDEMKQMFNKKKKILRNNEELSNCVFILICGGYWTKFAN